MDGGKRFLRHMLLAVLAVALGFAACQSYVFMEENKRQTATQRDFIPIESISKSDILFMVDNSGSMASKQQNLADNFKAFMEEVVKGQNDFHIGIVTTDVNFEPLQKCTLDVQCQLLLHSDKYKCVDAVSEGIAVKLGQKYCTAECTTDDDCPVSYDLGSCDPAKEICTPAMCGEVMGLATGKKYCVPMNNGRLRACKGALCTNYTPTQGEPQHQKIMTDKLRKQIGDDQFQAMFRDNVHVGTRGTGTEKGLASLKFALDPAFIDPLSGKNLIENENAGFFRADAKLTVIVVSDEEDCSYDPVACPECSTVELYATRCNPDPNLCHQDCTPSEPYDDGTGTLKCNTGYVLVEAQKETDMVRKGGKYCLKPCTTADQCPKSADLPPPACGPVDGFDVANYCSCQYNAPVTNTDSVFTKLVPPGDYATFFKSLKPLNNERVNMAVIVGAEKTDANAGHEPPAICVSPASGVACAGSRYYATASMLSRFFSDSICRSSFKDTLVKIVQFLVVSNEQELSDKPLDPSCVQVKINGVIVPKCGSQTDPADFISCRTSQADAGSAGDVRPCPEASWLCGSDDRCVDQNDTGTPKKECGCGDLSNTDKNCLCSKTLLPCKRINYWQYVPETCPDSTGKPAVLINGCGLAAGDKLEVNFLRGDSTTGGPIKCE